MSKDKKQDKEIKQLKKEVKTLKKDDEKKWYDQNQSSLAVSTSGAILPLLGLPIYDGSDVNSNKQNEREGNKINMLSYKLHGEVYIDQNFASPDSNNKVRIIVVQMTDDNINPPLLSDILENPTGNNALYAFYKIDGTRRFTRKYDKIFNLQNVEQTASTTAGMSATTSTERFRKTFKIKVKLPKTGLVVKYQQGSVSGNGPVSNGMYLIAYSDSGVISHPAIQYRSRMRFLDN
jgi:hypothetical protein